MLVKELIEKLQKEDPDRIVIISRDSEGNGHSPLSRICLGAYAATTSWYGEVGLDELTEEDRKAGYSEEDVIEGERAIILCPVN